MGHLTVGLDVDWAVRWLTLSAQAMADHRVELIELDRAIGDSDHGENMDRGFKAVMEDAVAEALDGPEHLYISIDIDSLDPAYAPATGTPEPGGIVAADLLRMVRHLAYHHHVVAMDVVEVAPAYDQADVTINVAHRLFTECLAGMAARRRDAAGASKGRPAR
jgi:agmatinase